MVLKRFFTSTVLFVAVASLQSINLEPAVADSNYASLERREAAVGHYSRSRALLIEALREFEAGRKIAKPDMLLDAEEWRISVVSRTEELNRVLDPKPRVSKSGVYYSANPLLLRREKERLPAPVDEAKDSNGYAEQDFQRSRQTMTRARLNAETPKPADVTKVAKDPAPAADPATELQPAEEPIIPALDQIEGQADFGSANIEKGEVEQLRDEAQNTVEKRIEDQSKSEPEKAMEFNKLADEEKSAKNSGETERLDTTGEDSDEEIAAAIEQAIKARMEKLSNNPGQ